MKNQLLDFGDDVFEILGTIMDHCGTAIAFLAAMAGLIILSPILIPIGIFVLCRRVYRKHRPRPRARPPVLNVKKNPPPLDIEALAKVQPQYPVPLIYDRSKSNGNL